MECAVCFDGYNLGPRRPKMLPCGHTVCGSCVRNPNFGRKCPLDREVFPHVNLRALPDNVALISLLSGDGGKSPKQFLWCRDCDEQLTGDCLDAGHRACSLKALCAERVAPLAAQLQVGVAAEERLRTLGEKAGPLMTALMQLLKEDRMAPVLARLTEAASAGDGLRDAVREAARLLPAVDDLWEGARLAGASGQCSLALEADDGWVWCGQMPLEADPLGNILRFALQMALWCGVLRPVPAWSPLLNLRGLRLEDLRPEERHDMLRPDRLARVRQLWFMNASPLALKLLEQVAPKLQELSLYWKPNPGDTGVSEEHLQVLRMLGRLTKLRELCLNVSNFGVPLDLPASLTTLCLHEACRETLLSVQRLPRLRTLMVRFYTGADVLFEVPQSSGRGRRRGLHTLKVTMRHRNVATLKSLLRAHAATLRHLVIGCSAVPVDPRYFPWCARPAYALDGLGRLLARCRLRSLLSVVLERHDLSHKVRSCRLQLREVRNALPGVDVSCDVCGPRP